MAVPCGRCGREYDVSLFEFGRTISCTCGSRVGVEPRVRPLGHWSKPRFAADAMLGRLARWLRLLGFDCAYSSEITDEQIVRLAAAEGRVILTRDRGLAEEWWVDTIYRVRAEALRPQLAEVVQHFDLSQSIRALTRCSDCNRDLSRVVAAEVSGRVPARVFERHDAFSECPDCGRVYWEGTHAARVRSVAASLTDA